jgi:hypothetical protein
MNHAGQTDPEALERVKRRVSASIDSQQGLVGARFQYPFGSVLNIIGIDPTDDRYWGVWTNGRQDKFSRNQLLAEAEYPFGVTFYPAPEWQL